MPMTKIFTENDLVRFLYGEVNEDERKAIKESILNDNQLRIKISELRKVVQSLNAFIMKAPEDIVSKAMCASRNI